MSDLVVRRLLVDLGGGFDRHWAGGDAFRSAFFNALSMSFPVGEQFFIDAVRGGFDRLDATAREACEASVRGFIGQEATHRRLHALYNDELQRQGLHNHWADRAARRIRRFDGVDPRHPLGVTAAYEHFTAILAHWLLSRPEALHDADPRLATLWSWHAAEESEHKVVAFDLYRALGGDERWRTRWFRIATFYFITDVLRQTINNLWHDGTLLRASTWRSGWRLMFGTDGLVRTCFGAWRAYFATDFHPTRLGDDALARVWLADHAASYRVVGADADR